MCAQLDFEVIFKRSQKEGRLANFHEFWSEEVHCKKDPQKKTLMFECWNLVDLMKSLAIIFLRLI